MSGYGQKSKRSRTGKEALPASISAAQREEIKEAFELFDTDGDGALDYHEVKVAMRALGFDMKKPEVLKLIRENSEDDRGVMTYAAFTAVMEQKIKERDPGEEIRRAFHLFAGEGGRKITFESLQAVANELGENLGAAELQAMIDEFDLDNDGAIDEAEFFKIMTEEA
ncbi:EF-hand [Clavulina sp. PMI_390]|nr:EF-hand [Clavulina sp. PMI_390]